MIRAAISKKSSSHYIITIVNKTKEEQKIKLLSSHFSFSIQGEKTKLIGSLSTDEFEIITQEIDFNLRYPVFSVIIQKHRVNRGREQPSSVSFHLPLPITIWDFCQIKKDQGNDDVFQGKNIIKYSSNSVRLNKSYQSIENCLP